MSSADSHQQKDAEGPPMPGRALSSMSNLEAWVNAIGSFERTNGPPRTAQERRRIRNQWTDIGRRIRAEDASRMHMSIMDQAHGETRHDARPRLEDPVPAAAAEGQIIMSTRQSHSAQKRKLESPTTTPLDDIPQHQQHDSRVETLTPSAKRSKPSTNSSGQVESVGTHVVAAEFDYDYHRYSSSEWSFPASEGEEDDGVSET